MSAKTLDESASAVVAYQPMMRHIAASERPRERLENHGAQALSNAELIAILLRVGIRGENVLRIAASERPVDEACRPITPALLGREQGDDVGDDVCVVLAAGARCRRQIDNAELEANAE